MLASSGPLPPGELSREPKWDGCRVQVLVDGRLGRCEVVTRSDNRLQSSGPELGDLVVALDGWRAVLDGELVAGDGGSESFYELGAGLVTGRPATVQWQQRARPVTLVAFDLLWLDGVALVDRPYGQRRESLESLELAGQYWVTTPVYRDGDAR